VPMDDAVTKLLTRLVANKHSSQPLFTNTKGECISDIRTAFLNALHRSSIKGLHFHDLRHTFASQYMMAGGDLYVLKEILGHKSIVMTQRYSHLSPSYQSKMLGIMEGVWSSALCASLQVPSSNSETTGAVALGPPPDNRSASSKTFTRSFPGDTAGNGETPQAGDVQAAFPLPAGGLCHGSSSAPTTCLGDKGGGNGHSSVTREVADSQVCAKRDKKTIKPKARKTAA
jgi:hypothetical protein